MKKLDAGDPETESRDLVADNIEQLKSLFPEAFTEGKIDFAVLKQLLGGAVDEREEKYGLNWHGKRRARQLALTPSMATLRPCPDESVDWDTTQNLMIEGDNLEVLKLLQKSYAGKVKTIYIDPPYNTGNDFVYPDNLHDSIRNYLELTGQADESGRKLSSNRETSGRFHTDWLNMMLPRMALSRRLLRDDGVALISIDDNEADSLRLLCDEVFGAENFVAQLIWEKGRKNDAKLFSIGHDYILVYAKSVSHLTESKTRWREDKPGAAEIQAEYLRLKAAHGDNFAGIERALQEFYAGLPRSHPSKKLTRYSHVDRRGVWRDDNMSWPGGGGPSYDVIHPRTRLACAVPEGGWRYSTPAKMQQMIDAGRVLFRDDHTEAPIRKTYLVRVEDDEDEGDDPEAADAAIQVAGTYFYRSALQASNLMLHLFGEKVFDSPKDHEVIARWIKYTSLGAKDDLILDFFAGSGTTAHAVMALNATDGGSRRFVLVQFPEPLNPENADQEIGANFCDRIGRPRTIAEITKERVRRAGAASREADPAVRGDFGFRSFRLDSSNIRTWEPNRDNLDQALLDSVEHVKPGRTETDILYELLLKCGIDLCAPVETRQIAKKTVYAVGGGVLIVCLAEGIARNEVEPLAAGIVDWHKSLAPNVEITCIFRDSAFKDDVAKANMAAILEQHGLSNVSTL